MTVEAIEESTERVKHAISYLRDLADAVLVSDNPWVRIRKAADVLEQFTAAIGTPYVVPSCPLCHQPLTQTPSGKLFCPYCHAEYELRRTNRSVAEAIARAPQPQPQSYRYELPKKVKATDPAFSRFLVGKFLHFQPPFRDSELFLMR